MTTNKVTLGTRTTIEVPRSGQESIAEQDLHGREDIEPTGRLGYHELQKRASEKSANARFRAVCQQSSVVQLP
jgi:hypothetical protein